MDASQGPEESLVDDLLLQIAQEWDKAEQDVKLAEQISNKVVFPSIKELRYAGRRLVEVLKLYRAGAPAADIESLYRDIKFDCHRARHDAIDAGTAKIAADLEVMAKKLGYGPITKIYPDFGQLHRDLNEIRDQIAVSRGNTTDREFIYQEIENDAFPKIVKKFRGLQASEPAIKALAKSERSHKLLLLVLTVVEILVLIGIVAGEISSHWSFFSHL